ncbi:hypothetical protein GF406_19820 [candidate division KSB1 bacterium]|nr:hypothetical protein [candidate division KSB1 bacterium]
MSDYHEPIDEIGENNRHIVQALNSLREEIEAVDWYHQRVATCKDAHLRDILAHNRDEEIEHACMALEWLRRTMPEWDEHLRTYLFKEGDITELEESAKEEEEEKPSTAKGIGIGNLK